MNSRCLLICYCTGRIICVIDTVCKKSIFFPMILSPMWWVWFVLFLRKSLLQGNLTPFRPIRLITDFHYGQKNIYLLQFLQYRVSYCSLVFSSIDLRNVIDCNIVFDISRFVGENEWTYLVIKSLGIIIYMKVFWASSGC